MSSSAEVDAKSGFPNSLDGVWRLQDIRQLLGKRGIVKCTK